MRQDAERADALMDMLVDRVYASGRLRRDVVAQDVVLLLAGRAKIRVPDPTRTGQLRQRYLALLLAGRPSDDGTPLSGPAPYCSATTAPHCPARHAGEQNRRWRQVTS